MQTAPRQPRHRFPGKANSIALLLVLSSLCAATSLCALDKVVLQLKWRHQFQFAGYYAAIEKGYYKDAGLDVELREATPGHDPIHEVLDGHADFGVGTSNILLLRGQGQPVVVLAVIYQHSPFALLSVTSSGVRDIHDLAGKSIMMEPDAAELLAYFQNEGVDPKALHIIEHTFDVKDLLNGTAGGMSAYSTDEPFFLEQSNTQYLLFSPRSGGIDFYGDNLFTTEDQIRKHPARVKAFLDASLKGWKYALQHPDEIVDLILSKYNRGKTREQLLFEAEETIRLVHPELIELGYINPGRWEQIARTYSGLGMLPKDFSLSGFIYNPAPALDLHWVYWTTAALITVAVAALAWTLLITIVNHRLRHEIQARKDAEEFARRQSEEKTNFFAMLAHEVRTPLSGILGSLWLYRHSASEPEKHEAVDIAEGSAANLLRMVDNILDQAKLETHNVRIEAIPVTLHDFLKEIVDLYRATATSKSVTLSLVEDETLPTAVLIDPMRLRQILSNLLSNAVKFSNPGEVRLTARAESPNADNSRHLVFEVSDSGPGIPPDRIDYIFKPYAQASPSIARKHGGTGLGLSISSQLAALLGGAITVKSPPGQGATFILTVLATPVAT